MLWKSSVTEGIQMVDARQVLSPEALGQGDAPLKLHFAQGE